MNKKEMQKIIEEYIKGHPGTSFAEINDLFRENDFDYRGNCHVVLSGHKTIDGITVGKNIIAWSGWNKVALEILNSIVVNSDFYYQKALPFIYFADGEFLTIPIANDIKRDYKKKRWCPIEFWYSGKK